jgi:hypothetical protein
MAGSSVDSNNRLPGLIHNPRYFLRKFLPRASHLEFSFRMQPSHARMRKLRIVPHHPNG